MEEKGSVAGALVLVVLSWLVPGSGFIIKRNWWRGLIIFLLLNGTFALGLLLHGSVVVPELRYRSPGFNIVNILTFAGQMGNGGGSLLSLAYNHLVLPEEKRQMLGSHPWFDLAALYLLVSGCMNYFCVCSFYDRYYGRWVGGSGEGKDKQ